MSEGIDPDALNSAMTPSDKPGASGIDLGQLTSAMTSAEGAVHAPAHKPSVGAPTAARPQTQFQKSASPTADPELTWGETLHQAGENLVPSTTGVLGGVAHSILHPVQTAEALGHLATGAASQLGLGNQNPAQKAKTEQLVSALENHYKTAYGSVKGFKKALATDPASVAMDVSTPLTLGGGALADAAGVTGRVAGMAAKAGSYLDPVQLALKAASVPVKLASNPVTRTMSAMSTGVPAKVYQIAKKAGEVDDPTLKAAYTAAASGQTGATDYLTRTQAAIKGVKQVVSDDYMAKKGPLAQTPVDFTNTQRALTDAANKAAMGSRVGQVPQKAMDAINEAKAMVDNVASDPTRRTIDNVDALKQQIWDLKDLHPNMTGNYLNNIYHGVKSDLVAADPEYANMMEQYQTALTDLKNIASTVGANGKAPAAGAMLTKSLRSLKTKNGKDVLDQISQYDPTIPYMLAGHAVNQLGSGFMHTIGDTGVAALMGGALGHPAALPAAIAGLAASSPKLNAMAHYGSGAIGSAVDKLARPADAAYYAGRAGQQDDTPSVADPATDNTWQRILKQESGNRQFHSDGSVITSKKGAIGISQIMPETGPVAAKLAGVPWSLSRLKSDAAYNELLGRAYFESLVQQYDGDKAKAAAAYNGGPKNVDRALNKAQVSGNPWLSHMPAETRNYVPSVMRAKYAKGGKAIMSHEQLVSRLMHRAKQAREGEKNATKPLLRLPDSVVAKALEVAQRAI